MVLVLVGIASVVLVTGVAVSPSGALFPVLGAGVAARLTGPPAAGGAGLDPLLVIGCAVGGAVLAYLIVAAPLVVPAVRRSDRARPIDPVRFELDPAGRTILIEVAAGYGGDGPSLPAPLRLAILRLAAARYEHRGDEPDAARTDAADLAAPFRRMRL